MQAKFPDLQPLDWEGPNNFAIYGTGVNTQLIVDNYIKRCNGKIDFLCWAFYPPESVYDGYEQCKILRPYIAHANSAYKNIVKRTLYMQTWLFIPNTDWVTTYLTWLSGEMADSGWYREDGRPVIYIYDPPSFASTNLNINGSIINALAIWNSTIKPFLVARNAYIIGLGIASDAVLTSLGLHERVWYGPNGAGIPATGANHKDWQAQYAQDQAGWTPASGRNPGIGITTAGDMRMRQGDIDGNGIVEATGLAWGYGTARWADPPRIGELYAAMNTALRGSQAPTTMKRRVLIYSGSEISEGGPGNLWGNAQRGTSMLDPIGWSKNPASRPNTYTYGVDCNELSWTRTGTWGWTRTSAFGYATIIGAFASDELRSNTAASTLTFSQQFCTRLILRGGKAAGYGHADIAIDGYYVTTIDCSAASTQVNQLYYDSGVLSEGTHSITITVTGDGTVAPDWVQITCNPQSFVTSV